MVSPLSYQDISNIGLHHLPMMHLRGALRSHLVSFQVGNQVNYYHLFQGVQLQLGLPSLENDVDLVKAKNYFHL